MILKSVIHVNMHIKDLMMQTHCIADVERDAGMKSTDLISRQAAIDAVESAKTARTPDGEIYVAKLNAEMNIQILPSAEPDRKEGCWMTEVYEYGDGEEVTDRWVEREAQRGDSAYCSVCKGVAGLDGSEEYSLTQFCPHCGVKMKNAEK